ncbi:hypothetical protein COS31_03075 [Candidatus Roizmanbacteria bacterium CG02_land_8_20_14_3_00_36_15]|uniref:Uncharacterized protein n=2 Tax=Candidatus Roizmaniibacteriota TaxID=1752723 RepID=A0A2M8KL27_9BACT|nr:MAG: hypothetical protein COS31_03075 [Candidatus Roizmanbacteria bacterium CG02_land_8_20_14_3_00_36_15]PIY69581.1 MAG: hypothetical protein COY89_05645 [Candidatus Roizmanbacteria bacterium CG_4_10_14_0_8_um_filter_36_36]PJA52768.1 MAG: hypothetical protein CO166_04420 [Candidatus Roizmanbacteria bacterium CG_4_9_14_3_um_filter_36_11]PJC81200.1 MAG: hypothetical protein CO007_05960 [Candidatus Roizmanbacteria bacterium CG_4_8_14_3_um_filter_36_10]PJE60590.1 MAG: hypothetical protein COU86_
MFEATTLLERKATSGQPEILAIQVARDDVFAPHLDDPRIQEACGSFGLSVDLLRKLLQVVPDARDYKLTGPTVFSIPDEEGRIEEDVSLWTVDLPGIGLTEVSINLLHPAAVKPYNNTSLHLITKHPPYQEGDFEIIYGRRGLFKLTFPGLVEPIAPAVYGASRARDDVLVRPGTLVFIRAPAANGWADVLKEPCVFGYICNPPWSSQIAKKVLDLK